MNKLFTAVTLGALVAGPVLVQSANAQRLDPARERVIRDCMAQQNRDSHDGYEGKKGGGIQVDLPRLHGRPRGAAMRTTMLRYAVGVGLGGMLVLAAGTGFAQERTGPGATSQVAQYCVLPPDSPDAHRFYCEHADGWSGRAGNARV